MKPRSVVTVQSLFRCNGVVLSSFFLLWFALMSLQSFSQSRTDSLRVVLNGMSDDTSKVKAYYTFGNLTAADFPDTALALFSEGKSLAEKIGDEKGRADFSGNAIKVLNDQGRFREALNVARESLSIYESIGSKKDIARALINVGSEWHYLSDFQTASDYYLRSLAMMEEMQDEFHQRILNNNLASIFINLGQHEKGKSYAEKSLKIAEKLQNDYAISSSAFNVATAELYLGNHAAALKKYQQIERLGSKMNDYIVVLDGWLGQADTYSAMGDNATASIFYEKVIAYSRDRKAPEYEMYAYMGASDVLIRQHDHRGADALIRKGIDIAVALGSEFELKDLYMRAANLAEQRGLLADALRFRKKFEVLSDSVSGDKTRDRIATLEAKFELDKKQTQIASLEKEKQLQLDAINQKNKLNVVFIILIIALAGLIVLGYYTHQQRQLLHRRRLGELESEKKLAATEAVLQGETQERSRLAKDLHDGLGGMLSSIKMQLQLLHRKDAVIPHYDKTVTMVDASIREMRRIAHNMMPEALDRFGLDAALRDFCNDITQTGNLIVNYQSLNITDTSVNRNNSVTIYRIIQELVNNVIRHSGASSVLVQISEHGGNVSLTVEDDGKGFDVGLVDEASGIGWMNIRRRVELLNGRFEIASNSSGTSFYLEFVNQNQREVVDRT